MTDFDKALDDILLRHGAEQGHLHESMKREIKEAIKEHLIGGDEQLFIDGYDLSASGLKIAWSVGRLRDVNEPKKERNNIRAEQLKALGLE